MARFQIVGKERQKRVRWYNGTFKLVHKAGDVSTYVVERASINRRTLEALDRRMEWYEITELTDRPDMARKTREVPRQSRNSLSSSPGT